MAGFEVPISCKAKEFAALTPAPNAPSVYLHPPGSNKPPVLLPDYNRMRLEVAAEAASLAQKFADLKAAILLDMTSTGGDPTKIEFDDVNMVAKLGIGFKECVDRFGDATKAKLREAAGVPDQKVMFQDIFRDKFATAQNKQSYAQAGTQAFTKLRDAGYKDPATDVDIDDADDADDAVGTILQSQAGMTLNDKHGAPDGPKMLTESMDALGHAGVKTLFIEHFWQEQQDEIDEYLNSGDDDDMPAALKEAVRKLDDRPAFNGEPAFANLLAEAKRKKVRVVGLDEFNAKVPETQDPRRWEERASRFNLAAAKVVAKEKGAGKFVLLAGAKHNNTHSGGIPGIAQLLGVHNFGVEGGQLAKAPEDKTQRTMRTDGAQAFFDGYCAAFYKALPTAKSEIAYADIETYVRSQAATLDRMTPAAARKLGDVVAAKAVAQMQADKTSISTPIDAGKLDAATKKGGSLLHIAAGANDAALIQDLITAGQSTTALDADGNTPLHRLLTEGNKGVGPASKVLLDNGASLATRNTAGQTPLQNALEINYANPPFAKWIDDHKADFKTAATIKKGGLDALDMVIARGYVALENKMYDDGVVDDTPIAVVPTAPKTTPEILALATKCENPADLPQIQQRYQKLYDDFPEFRSTLDLSALSALGDRRNGKALRLFMASGDKPFDLSGGNGFGAFNDRNMSLALGINRTDDALLGTMIHELTHHAADRLFDNDTMPFPVVDPGHAMEQSYLDAIKTDVTGGIGALTEQDKTMARDLTGRVQSYMKGQGAAKTRINVNQEFIASVPQTLLLYGRDAIERRGGGLLDFWDNTMRPTMQAAVDTHPHAAKLRRQAVAGSPYKPDNPWGAPTDLNPEAVSRAVMNKVNFEHGVNPAGSYAAGDIPPPVASDYRLPEAIQVLPIVVAQTDTVAALQANLRGTKTTINAAVAGRFDAAATKIDTALALVNPDQQTLLAAITAINTDLVAANVPAKAFADGRETARQEILLAIQKIQNSGKLPNDIHSGVLDAFVERVANSVGTGPVDLVQLKRAVAVASVDFVGAARTAASRKADVDARAAKRADYRHMISNGVAMTPIQFAEAAVLEAERQYGLANPPPNGLPPEVDKTKQRELIAKLAQNLQGKPPQDFNKYVTFVKDNVLHTKPAKRIGTRDVSHQSISKRKTWVAQLAAL